MSYTNGSAAFAGGIQELSFDEIDQVDGGLAPLAAAALAAGGGFALGVAVGFGLIYLAKHI